MKIDLTKSQCESLIDFIESNLLNAIRNDKEFNNIEWVWNILNANAIFHQAIAESGKPLENPPEAPEELTKEAMIAAIESVCLGRDCNDCPLDKFKDNCFADENIERSYRTVKEAGFLDQKAGEKMKKSEEIKAFPELAYLDPDTGNEIKKILGFELYTLEETKELLRSDGYTHSAKRLYRSASEWIQQLERDKSWASENYDLIREENKRLEAQVSKWISVEERLPEASGKYIVCTEKRSVYCTKFKAYGQGGDFQMDINTHITHWMPMPEPPKEGSNA